MSGINVWPVTAQAVMFCSLCRVEWRSAVYTPSTYGDEVAACTPAFNRGWRIYVGGRGQRAYCPNCCPTVYMPLVFPKDPS